MKKQQFDINELLDRIMKVSGKGQKEVADHLGYKEAYLSAARKEPTEKIYNKLVSYEKELGISKEPIAESKVNQKSDTVSKDEHIEVLRKQIDLHEKYNALQEKHIALLEKQSNSSIEQKLNLFEEALKEILLNSRKGIHNQELIAAVNQQYQEYAIETIWKLQGQEVNGAEVLIGIERKAAERLLKIEKNGLRLPV